MSQQLNALTELERLAGADFVARLRVAAAMPDFPEDVQMLFGEGPEVSGSPEAEDIEADDE